MTKIRVQLRLWRLREHASIVQLLEDHDEAWLHAFRVFVERNLRSMPTVRLVRNVPVHGFPMTVEEAAPSLLEGVESVAPRPSLLWYGRELSPYIQVLPMVVEEGDAALIGEQESAAAISVDPRSVEWTVDVQWMQGVHDDVQDMTDGDAVVSVHAPSTGTPADAFDVPVYDGTARPARSVADSVERRRLARSESMASVSSSVMSEERRVLSMARTTLVLSCLLQYTPELYGVSSPHCFTVLRRFIIPEIVERLHQHHQPEIDMKATSGAHGADHMFRANDWNSFVEFDRGILQNTLEEWLSVGGMQRSAGNNLVAGQFHKDGRAAGLIMTGAKGIGKTMFCHDILRCLQDMAPWMVQIVYRDTSLDNQDSDLWTSDGGVAAERRSKKFFDGTYFLDSGNGSAGTAHMPLSHGPFCLNEASPRGILRMANLFKSFKAASRPGCVVLTVIDNIDLLIRSVQSHCVFTQLRAEMENANFEFFILGTSSDATLPSFDSIDSSKNQLRVINFRTLKIYNMPLKRAYEFVMRFVRFAPALAYPEKVMKMVRRCAIETIRNPPMDPTFRKDYERRLHAMLIFDLRKLSLHLCVDLAKTISRMAAADPAVLVCNDSHFFTSLMVQSMERVFNNSSTISGLTPPVNAVLPWVRQDAPAAPAIRNVVDDIFAKCVRNKQFVHFIRLEENDAAGVSRLGHAGYTKPWESRYGHPVMSLQDVHSFMHHLHQRFSFRSSFVLEAPEQLLPKNPKLSANTPRNNCNPFDEYYWQSKNSCLIVNTIESVIGYHEVYSRGYSTNSSEGFVHGKTKAKKANLFQYLAADVGGNSGLSSSRTNANSNSEGTVSLRKTGVNGRASIGNGKVFGLDGGVSKGWMTDRSIGNSIGQSLSRTVPWGTNLNLSYTRVIDSGSSLGVVQEKDKHTGESHGYGITRIFEHIEAMSKVIVGLKTITDRGGRYADDLRNVVIIFYNKEGCFDELAIRRLGWAKDGSYVPPQVGCPHYTRNIRVYASCCDTWVDCEHCHDAHCKDGHKMDPRAVDHIQCLICYTRQQIVPDSEAEDVDKTHGVRCSNPNCGRAFAIMQCVPCRIWREHLGPDGVRHCGACDRCYPSNYYLHHHELCAQEQHGELHQHH